MSTFSYFGSSYFTPTFFSALYWRGYSGAVLIVSDANAYFATVDVTPYAASVTAFPYVADVTIDIPIADVVVIPH